MFLNTPQIHLEYAESEAVVQKEDNENQDENDQVSSCHVCQAN